MEQKHRLISNPATGYEAKKVTRGFKDAINKKRLEILDELQF